MKLKNKKYLLLKKDVNNEIQFLSKPKIWVSISSHAKYKECNDIKEAIELYQESRIKFPEDFILIYKICSSCYLPLLQIIKNIFEITMYKLGKYK